MIQGTFLLLVALLLLIDLIPVSRRNDASGVARLAEILRKSAHEYLMEVLGTHVRVPY